MATLQYEDLSSAPAATRIPQAFESAEPECVSYLLGHCVVTEYPKDTVVLELGTPSPDLLLVASGLMVAEVPCTSGAFLPARFMTQGNAMAATFVPGERSPMQFRTLMPSKVVSLPCAEIIEACQTWPKFSLGYTANLMRRINQILLGQARVAAATLEVKLAYLLWDLAIPSALVPEGDKYLPCKLSQKLLAAYFNAPREEVSRKLSALQRAGLWDKVDGGFWVSAEMERVFTRVGLELPTEQFTPFNVVELMQKYSIRAPNPETAPLHR